MAVIERRDDWHVVSLEREDGNVAIEFPKGRYSVDVRDGRVYLVPSSGHGPYTVAASRKVDA